MKWAIQKGFTIVELLIVIVVIGILAGVTVVGYNGISNRANDTAVQNDLRNFGAKTMNYVTVNNRLPNVTQLVAEGLRVTKDAYGSNYIPAGTDGYNLIFCMRTSDKAFAYVAASRSGKVYVFINGAVSEGVGPLMTSSSTCPNNGMTDPSAVSWLFDNGAWRPGL